MTTTHGDLLSPQDDIVAADPERLRPRHVPWGDIAVATAGLVALWTGNTLLSLPAVLWLLSGLLHQTTRMRGLLLALLVAYGCTAAILTMLSVLRASLDGRVLLGLALAGLAILSFTRPAMRFANGRDVYGACTGLLIFIVFYRPHAGTSAAHSLGTISSTTDAGSHLHMIRHVLHEGSYLTLIPGLENKLFGDSENYPPAFAGVVGVLLRPVLGPDPEVQMLVRAVVPAVIALYALFACLTVILTLDVLAGRPHRGAASAVAVVAVASTFVFGPLTLFLRSAAYAQMVAATMLVGCVVVAANRSNARRSVTILAVLTVGAAQSWYLLAPLLVVPWSLMLRKQRLTVVLHGLLTAPFCLFPVLNGPDGKEQLQEGGFLLVPGEAAMAATLVITLVGVIAVRRETLTQSAGRQVVRLTGISVGLILAVGSYQILSDGVLSYYVGKLLYLTLLFSAMLAGVLAAVFYRAVEAIRTPLSATACALIPTLSLSVSFLVTTPEHVIPLLAGEPKTEDFVRALDGFLERHPEGVQPHSDVYVLMPCDQQREHHVNRLVYSLSTSFSDDRAELVFRLGFDDISPTDMFNERAAERPVEVLVLQRCPGAEALTFDKHVRLIQLPGAQG